MCTIICSTLLYKAHTSSSVFCVPDKYLIKTDLLMESSILFSLAVHFTVWLFVFCSACSFGCFVHKAGSCLLLSYCVSAHCAVFLWFHWSALRPYSAVLSQSPMGIKEPRHWKESRDCCLTTFCVLYRKLSFRQREAICLQTKSRAPSLLPRRAEISLSGLFLICPFRLSHGAQL